MSINTESDLYWYQVLVKWQDTDIYGTKKNKTFSKKPLSVHKTLDEAEDYVNLCKKELTNIAEYKIIKLESPLS